MTDRPFTLDAFGREFGLPILLGASLIIVWLLGPEATDLLMYQRVDVQAGQIWRLLTAHLVHLNAQHLFLNATALAVIWWFFKPSLAGRAGYILTGMIALGQSLLLFLLHPDVWWFAGFSGVLHGLLVAGALLSRDHTPLLSLLIVIVVTVKLALELTLGANPGMTQLVDKPILVEAHLYGAVTGFLVASLLKPDHWYRLE